MIWILFYMEAELSDITLTSDVTINRTQGSKTHYDVIKDNFMEWVNDHLHALQCSCLYVNVFVNVLPCVLLLNWSDLAQLHGLISLHCKTLWASCFYMVSIVRALSSHDLPWTSASSSEGTLGDSLPCELNDSEHKQSWWWQKWCNTAQMPSSQTLIYGCGQWCKTMLHCLYILAIRFLCKHLWSLYICV